jgi:hypothetical protein
MNQQKKKNIYEGERKLIGASSNFENLSIVGPIFKTKKNYCGTEY